MPKIRKWKRVTPISKFPRMVTRIVSLIVIHHDVVPMPARYNELIKSDRPFDRDLCIEMERDHMTSLDRIAVNRGFLGISYIFVVFASGRIWKGRGFNREGAHTYGYNDRAVGFVAAGNYEVEPTRKALLDGFGELICMAKRRKRATKDATVKGHRDMPNAATVCPGKNLYVKLPKIRKRAEDCK